MKPSNHCVGGTKRPQTLSLTVDEPVGDVMTYVCLAHNPSVHTYHMLKSKIDQSSPKWLASFLDHGGLDTLLEALCQLAGYIFTNFSDAVLQLDCISCVKAVLNSSIGMQHAIQYEQCVFKLVQALNTPNTLPKKQMFELLTAVAMYSMEGHSAVMKGFRLYKKLTNQQHIFSVLVNELKNSETATYRVTLMSLINVILRGHSEVRVRSRIRDQFIGLNLLEIINFIRKDDREPELAVQLELFDSDKFQDEETLCRINNVDVSSQEELFSVLCSKTSFSPVSIHLLHILQDLVLMEEKKQNSELVWSTLAELVHHVVGLDSDQLKTFSVMMNKVCQDFHTDISKTNSASQMDQIGEDKKPSDVEHMIKPSGQMLISDEEKLILYKKQDENVLQRRDSGISVTSPDNMTELAFRRQSSSRESWRECYKLLRRPQKRVKHVFWEPLTVREAQKPLSVWHMVTQRSYHSKISLDYPSVEDEFEEMHNLSASNDAANEIHLLEPSESLSINLLLARLEAMPEELAQAVIEGDTTDLTPSAVQLLLDTIPPQQQIARIQASEFPHFTLAPAEQFLAFLSNHTDYMTMLYGLKFKVTFQTEFPKLKAAFEAVTLTCKDVLHHRSLRDFLRVMLDMGNFLNASDKLEPAAGIKLSSWKKFAEVRGRQHDISLLTFLIRQVESQSPDLLWFIDEFPLLEEATSHSFDDLRKRVSGLNVQLKQFLSKLGQSEKKTKDHFQQLVEEVKKDLANLHGNIAQLKGLLGQMAMYFCEDEITFDLQKCLQDLLDFIKLMKSCKKESHLLHQQRVMAEKRKLELKKQLEDAVIMQHFGKKADLCSSFVQSQLDPLVDHLLDEIHRGSIFYHQDSLLQTPDDKLGVSIIPRIISTPIDSLDMDLESSSFIFQAPGSDDHLTPGGFFDKLGTEHCPKTIIGVAPCAESETLEDTLVSNHEPGNLAAKCRQAGFTSEMPQQELEIIIYPKLKSPAVARRKQGHIRCNSDLNGSRVVEENWKVYEKQKESEASFENLQSSSMVTSLGLETKIVKIMDAPKTSQKKVFICEPEKPVKDKKKKVGFFQRLSQVVLRQRNVNIDQGQDHALNREFTRGSKRWSGKGRRSRKSLDKENVFRENLV